MEYDLVIFGATFAGLGAAYASKGNTLIIDHRPQVGYEFISAYKNIGNRDLKIPLSNKGELLRSELLERNILSHNGKMYIPDMLPIIYYMIWKDKLPILLLTHVLSVTKKSDHYEIEIYNTEGKSILKTKRILDTTEGLDKEHRPRILQKRLNALLWNGEEEKITLIDNHVKIFPANKSGHAILSMELEHNDGYSVAREKIHTYWEKRDKALSGWTIAVIADYFEFVLECGTKKIDDGYRIISSCYFPDPLEAFEAGAAFLEEFK